MGLRKWARHREGAVRWLAAALAQLPAVPLHDAEHFARFLAAGGGSSGGADTEPPAASPKRLQQQQQQRPQQKLLQVQASTQGSSGGGGVGGGGGQRDDGGGRRGWHARVGTLCRMLLGNTRLWGREAMFSSPMKQPAFQLLRAALRGVRCVRRRQHSVDEF